MSHPEANPQYNTSPFILNRNIFPSSLNTTHNRHNPRDKQKQKEKITHFFTASPGDRDVTTELPG